MGKTFVKVTAEHDETGKQAAGPDLDHGKQYEIEWVTDVRMAPSLKGGGFGDAIYLPDSRKRGLLVL